MGLFGERKPRHIRIIEAIKRRIDRFARELAAEETRSDDGDAKLKLGGARAILERASRELESCAQGTGSTKLIEAKDSPYECPVCYSRVPEEATECPHCGAQFADDEGE